MADEQECKRDEERELSPIFGDGLRGFRQQLLDALPILADCFRFSSLAIGPRLASVYGAPCALSDSRLAL
jgi:hypothetical protein